MTHSTSIAPLFCVECTQYGDLQSDVHNCLSPEGRLGWNEVGVTSEQGADLCSWDLGGGEEQRKNPGYSGDGVVSSLKGKRHLTAPLAEVESRSLGYIMVLIESPRLFTGLGKEYQESCSIYLSTLESTGKPLCMQGHSESRVLLRGRTHAWNGLLPSLYPKPRNCLDFRVYFRIFY